MFVCGGGRCVQCVRDLREAKKDYWAPDGILAKTDEGKPLASEWEMVTNAGGDEGEIGVGSVWDESVAATMYRSFQQFTLGEKATARTSDELNRLWAMHYKIGTTEANGTKSAHPKLKNWKGASGRITEALAISRQQRASKEGHATEKVRTPAVRSSPREAQANTKFDDMRIPKSRPLPQSSVSFASDPSAQRSPAARGYAAYDAYDVEKSMVRSASLPAAVQNLASRNPASISSSYRSIQRPQGCSYAGRTASPPIRMPPNDEDFLPFTASGSPPPSPPDEQGGSQPPHQADLRRSMEVGVKAIGVGIKKTVTSADLAIKKNVLLRDDDDDKDDKDVDVEYAGYGMEFDDRTTIESGAVLDKEGVEKLLLFEKLFFDLDTRRDGWVELRDVSRFLSFVAIDMSVEERSIWISSGLAGMHALSPLPPFHAISSRSVLVRFRPRRHRRRCKDHARRVLRSLPREDLVLSRAAHHARRRQLCHRAAHLRGCSQPLLAECCPGHRRQVAALRPSVLHDLPRLNLQRHGH